MVPKSVLLGVWNCENTCEHIIVNLSEVKGRNCFGFHRKMLIYSYLDGKSWKSKGECYIIVE